MKTIVFKFFLLSIVTLNASAAMIDRMHVASLAQHWYVYSPITPINGQFTIFPVADYYVLDDGSSWERGAGWAPETNTTLSSVSVEGSIISYNFNSPDDGILFQNIDYNESVHSTQGVLGVFTPLTIIADLGGTTAKMTGYTEIISNDETWPGGPTFNYYSASVGELVYFEVNYELNNELNNGAIFDEDLFNKRFSYRLSGVVDFTTAVPLPSALPLIASSVLALFSVSWRRRSYRVVAGGLV